MIRFKQTALAPAALALAMAFSAAARADDAPMPAPADASSTAAPAPAAPAPDAQAATPAPMPAPAAQEKPAAPMPAPAPAAQEKPMAPAPAAQEKPAAPMPAPAPAAQEKPMAPAAQEKPMAPAPAAQEKPAAPASQAKPAAAATAPAAAAKSAPAASKPAAAPAPNAAGEAAMDNSEPPSPTRQSWSFSGLFGVYDQQQLQRGFHVYHDVCSACHSLSIPFRTLADPQGPGFSDAQVKALAATYQVTNSTPNDKGEIFKRPGIPSDLIPPPDAYPNPEAAAAVLGKAPPDMSVLAKARKYELGFPWFVFAALPGNQYQEVGADYIYAILTGYTHPDDPQWNLYYAGHRIAMPQPLSDDIVDYSDGTPPTAANYAKDVTAFLAWASEPTLAERKKIGLRVMIFLIVFAGLLYFTKKRVWEKLH